MHVDSETSECKCLRVTVFADAGQVFQFWRNIDVRLILLAALDPLLEWSTKTFQHFTRKRAVATTGNMELTTI